MEQLIQDDWDLKCQDPQALFNVKALGFSLEWLSNPGVGFMHEKNTDQE